MSTKRRRPAGADQRLDVPHRRLFRCVIQGRDDPERASWQGRNDDEPLRREEQLHVVAAVRPVHPDVGQHERLAIRAAGELGADGRANDAVHAVGADGDAGREGLLAVVRAQGGLDAARFLAQASRGHAPVDPTAKRQQAIRQDALRDVLRQHQQVGMPRRQPVERNPQQLAIPVTNGEGGQLQSLGDQAR